jgi:nucleotidyltransferase substrate binding protein (TIGR01987 family)
MEEQKRWQQRLEDFDKAIARLEKALKKDSFEELEKDGVIQRFEFIFELAWKTLKDYLEDQGFTDVVSPKQALRKAFETGLITNDELWLQMQEDRNKMSHLYDQAESEEIFEHIRSRYAEALGQLAHRLHQ